MEKEELLELTGGTFCISVNEDKKRFDKLNELTGGLFKKDKYGHRFQGNGTYYGFLNGEIRCTGDPWCTAYTIEEFEVILNQRVQNLDIF